MIPRERDQTGEYPELANMKNPQGPRGCYHFHNVTWSVTRDILISVNVKKNKVKEENSGK